jgi:hypothetical protein
MGVLTLEQIREEVYFDLGNRTDTAADSGTRRGVNETRLDLWINDALRHLGHPNVFVHRQLMHTFTLTMVDGTNSYTFDPAGAVSISGIRFASYLRAAADSATVNKRKLKLADDQWFAERTLNTGEPSIYAVEGDQLLLTPVPGASQAAQLVKVHAWRYPPLLVAGATTTLEPQWDELLILGARWRAELHLGLLDLATETRANFAGLLNEYKDWRNANAEDWDWISPTTQGASPMEMA